MKFIIVGLGNPGDQYLKTRHNVGFRVLDKIAEDNQVDFYLDKYVYRTDVSFKSRKLILLKPNTFMNLSGKAVLYWMKKEKISNENILVVTDDISLPFGKLRLRKKGSHGGHNGLLDIQNHIGDKKFARLRFGIGSDFNKGQQASFVLSNFSSDEEKELSNKINLTIQIIQEFAFLGVERAMSNFNAK
tara:strand:- start:74 stop:637 length:564 start_codon:yes stop_codon:yes gene_type:complete